MQKRFSTPDKASVHVELGAGHLVARAEEVSEVVVEVTGPRAEEFRVDHHGGRVAVIAPQAAAKRIRSSRRAVSATSASNVARSP